LLVCCVVGLSFIVSRLCPMMRSVFSRILGVLSAAFDSEVPPQQGELLLYEYRSFVLVCLFDVKIGGVGAGHL
jgi:hypothetical protein